MFTPSTFEGHRTQTPYRSFAPEPTVDFPSVLQTPWLGTLILGLKSAHDQDVEGVEGKGNGDGVSHSLANQGI